MWVCFFLHKKKNSVEVKIDYLCLDWSGARSPRYLLTRMLVEVISIHILGKSFCDISRPRLIAGEHRIGWACFCCIHRALCTKSYSLLYAQESKYQLKDAVMYPNPVNCGRAERRASWLLLRTSIHDAWESKPTMMWEYFTYEDTRNDVRVGVCCVPRCFMRERANKNWKMPWCIPTSVYCVWALNGASRRHLQTSMLYARESKNKKVVWVILHI